MNAEGTEFTSSRSSIPGKLPGALWPKIFKGATCHSGGTFYWGDLPGTVRRIHQSDHLSKISGDFKFAQLHSCKASLQNHRLVVVTCCNPLIISRKYGNGLFVDDLEIKSRGCRELCYQTYSRAFGVEIQWVIKLVEPPKG